MKLSETPQCKYFDVGKYSPSCEFNRANTNTSVCFSLSRYHLSLHSMCECGERECVERGLAHSRACMYVCACGFLSQPQKQ